MEHPRIWRSAETGRYYKQPEPNVFEAQMIQPGDISEIEAVAILDEVLGRRVRLRKFRRGEIERFRVV